MAIRPPANTRLRSFVKNMNVIAEGGREIIHYERSNSYEYMKVTVSYQDWFGERFESVFEGNRDGLKLVSYPILKKTAPNEETPE